MALHSWGFHVVVGRMKEREDRGSCRLETEHRYREMLGQSSVLGVVALEIVILGFKQGVS